MLPYDVLASSPNHFILPFIEQTLLTTVIKAIAVHRSIPQTPGLLTFRMSFIPFSLRFVVSSRPLIFTHETLLIPAKVVSECSPWRVNKSNRTTRYRKFVFLRRKARPHVVHALNIYQSRVFTAQLLSIMLRRPSIPPAVQSPSVLSSAK